MKPYYRILTQTSPVSYLRKNQLTGNSTNVHAEHIRLANVDDWEIPVVKMARQRWYATYVVPPGTVDE